MEEMVKKVDILIEALPYIKKFHNKVMVIKYGGSILAEEKIRKVVLQDIVFLNFVGIKIVLVHGGGPSISERMRQEGRKTEFFDGMRVTDEETLQVVEGELRRLNALIVEELKTLGAKAVSLDGKKDEIILAKKKKAKIDLGFVGQIARINCEPILKEINKGYISVVLPMGKGDDERAYNVNADESASYIASSLGAEKLILLTNVSGIMRNPDESNSLISTLSINEARELIKEKVVQEGMIPKVEACIFALENGVKKTHIIDARLIHSLLLEIFTDKGIGTEIIR